MPRQSYADKREASAQESRRQSQAGRDVSADWPKKDRGTAKRRKACERDLLAYLQIYHQKAFYLPWSRDQLTVIDRLEECCLHGGLFALAMPRSSGKTALTLRAAVWAILNGHRRFVAIIAATERMGQRLLGQAKRELTNSDLLYRDFRQVCHPVRRLQNNARRCVGQLFGDTPTAIEWGNDRIILPTVPDSACDGPNVSGSILVGCGLTASIRGLSYTLQSGEIIRPDLVLLDDPQTRASAMSPIQCAEREDLITGEVLSMAAPGETIAVVATCTTIRADDVADRLLDRSLNPQWRSQRTKAIYQWPTSKLWEEYHRIRAVSFNAEGRGEPATEFYRQHQAEMDRGAEVAWPERFGKGEISALQHLQNLLHDLGEPAFLAEYQNDPMRMDGGELEMLTAVQVARRVSGVPRGVVPQKATHLTAAVDVHDNLLFWAVSAWAPGFTGWVVDYGTYPDQRRRTFTQRRASPTMGDLLPGAGHEAAILAGLKALTADILAREWERADGAAMRVGKCLIDASFVPDLVHQFCQESQQHRAILLPSRGQPIAVGGSPMTEWTVKEGEEHGLNWVISKPPNRQNRHVRFDPNFWKSFVHHRLGVAIGDPGSLTLHGHEPADHELYSEHMVAEVATLVNAGGRTTAVWRIRPGTTENHWLDATVLTALAASILGIKLGVQTPAAPAAKRTTWREAWERQHPGQAGPQRRFPGRDT